MPIYVGDLGLGTCDWDLDWKPVQFQAPVPSLHICLVACLPTTREHLMQLRAHNPSDYLYILGTVLFTVYGQLALKWQMSRVGPLPDDAADRATVLVRLFLNPWVISCVLSAVLAMICWMLALSKFQLTYAYPFMSLTFVLVLVLGALLFREPVTAARVAGIALIVAGVVTGARG